MKDRKYYTNLVKETILDNFSVMFRQPGGRLKQPYIDPSGQYGGQLWDWDAMLTSKSLFRLLNETAAGKITGLREIITKHTRGALMNFFEYQAKDGTIPMSITSAGGDVFRTRVRKKKDETNMAKPVFGQFMEILVENTGDMKIARNLFDRLLMFYDCYRKHYLDNGTGLFVWGSDVAIGVDDDPSTWARPPFSSANIYLNALMCSDLKHSSRLAGKLGRSRDSANLLRRAKTLEKSILKYCWDERDGFFYTADVLVRKKEPLGWLHKNLEPFWKCLPLKIMNWSGFLPMYASICSRQQARIMVTRHLMNKKRFLSNYGIRSLSADEKMYQPEVERGNPSNWLGPVWLPANYFICEGLKSYGFSAQASEISSRVIRMLGKDIERTGTLHEYYSPETGRGLEGRNFWNWNMLVLFMT